MLITSTTYAKACEQELLSLFSWVNNLKMKYLNKFLFNLQYLIACFSGHNYYTIAKHLNKLVYYYFLL